MTTWDLIRVLIPLGLFGLGVILGFTAWLMKKHEEGIVLAIRRVEKRMDDYDKTRHEDMERIHKIEMTLIRHEGVFIKRSEFSGDRRCPAEVRGL